MIRFGLPAAFFEQTKDFLPKSVEPIYKTAKIIREKTRRGKININTNAGHTANIKKIVDAGLDCMRVSIISAIEENYAAYYRAGYTLGNVKESVAYALKKGVNVSLNLLYMPGFTDNVREVAAWQDFFTELPVNTVQIRNLNIDPDVFWQKMPPAPTDETMGTKRFLRLIAEKFPDIRIASFTH